MAREGFVPVHDEEDAVKFEYEVTPFIFGASRLTPPPDSPAEPSLDANGNGKDYSAAEGVDDKSAPPDFLGFDDEDEQLAEVRLIIRKMLFKLLTHLIHVI